MGAAVPKLTALKVKHAKPGRHGDGEGLYLLVSDTGAKSWIVRVMAHDAKEPDPDKRWKRRDIGLGPLWQCSLEQAREKAREVRILARSGVDPVLAREEEDEVTPTFLEAAKAAHKALTPGWQDRHANAFLSTLELHAFPKIGAMPVDEVEAKDLLTVLAPLWHDKPAAARKVRQRLGVVLDYAMGMKWRDTGSPRDGLRPLLAKQAKAGKFASMPYKQVPAFVDGLKNGDATVGRLALLFTIYTAARQGEVRRADWSHFDLEGAIWNRPADLMKSGEEHSVTLSAEALAILERVKKLHGPCEGFVFAGRKGSPLSDMTLAKMVRPTGYTVHGFRSSFKTWAVEKMPSIPNPVSEAALSHTIPDKVEAAYNRADFLDMRRTLLDAWGRFAAGSAGEVIQLPLQLRG